ncbi:hypothetical protein EVG20_g10163 [Dentipellis fragilis]|uniref:Histone deacetylase complex subunit SAP30 Sin3 binding domain-containing protein n=1 Tax=Dentipellis fragilis TaxID=205917 RepID=A0A4Y9XTF7_9AGAM|nr:hypothetical protein EVG20_g10163 [Dentipellis fragilis]
MAPPTTASAQPSAPAQPPAPRPRGQPRRKQNDDAAYAGPSSAGAKRLAAESVDGDGRAKRKRVDALLPPTSMHTHAHTVRVDGETKPPMVDFSTLPSDALHRYLIHYELMPQVFPSPLTVHDPSPPSMLLQLYRSTLHAPSPPRAVTPANRPRRESREQSRRRSSRALEETQVRTPILADVREVDGMLATIAQRHFEEHVVKEVDTLALFMCAVKAKEHLPG